MKHRPRRKVKLDHWIELSVEFITNFTEFRSFPAVGGIGTSPNPMIHSPMQQMNQGPNTPGGGPNPNNNLNVNQAAAAAVAGNGPPQMYGMGPNQVSN